MALCPHRELELTAAGGGSGELRGDLVRDRPKVGATLGAGRDSSMGPVSLGISSPSSLSSSEAYLEGVRATHTPCFTLPNTDGIAAMVSPPLPPMPAHLLGGLA